MLKANLTISRPSSSRASDDPFIRIVVRDSSSRTQFLEIDVPLASFAEALTGLSEVECDMKVRDLDRVGLIKESKSVSFDLTADYLKKYGIHAFERKKIAYLMEQDPDNLFQQENGWALSLYLGSQNSIACLPDNAIRINTSAHRYVKPNKENP
jgi:hypothetical protein